MMMENEYRENNDRNTNENSMNQYNTGNSAANDRGEYHYSYQKEPQKKPKKKRGAPTWLKVVGLALIFGIVAAIAFQGTNYIADRVTGSGTTTVESTPAITDAPAKSADSTAVVEGDTVTDVTNIAEKAMPSVVSITNMSVQEVQSFFGSVQEYESESMGSGIIIAQNETELLIVTNNHVVEGNKSLTVTFIDEESVEANVKGTDSKLDVAVVAVNLDDIKDSTKESISLAQMGDSTDLKVGEPAIAIGNALGYGQSVTSGIISAVDREIDGYDGKLIQTDAAINPGNSGGALLNASGDVIGINVAKVAEDAVEGMGYAIPISNAKDVIDELMTRETRAKVSDNERGQLGISGIDVDSDSAQLYNMPVGVYVSEVVSGSGAEKAGITQGCIITGFNGMSIDGMTTLQEQLDYYKAGETVTLTVEEPSGNTYETKTVEVTLGENSQ